MFTEMERSGHLDRAVEAVPSDDELQVRSTAGRGLTSPELAVLMAYEKIGLKREINESPLPDDEWTRAVLVDYFPTPLRERFADVMSRHRLRREIVTTTVVNEVINRGGISFVFRAAEETGADPADIIRAYMVVRDVYDLPTLWRALEGLDNQISTAVQTEVNLEVRRLVDRAVRWLVTSRRAPIDVTAEMSGRSSSGMTSSQFPPLAPNSARPAAKAASPSSLSHVRTAPLVMPGTPDSDVRLVMSVNVAVCAVMVCSFARWRNSYTI